MGGVANTKTRGVRIDDDLWTRAMAKAERRRETVAAVIKRALLAYVEDDDETATPMATEAD